MRCPILRRGNISVPCAVVASVVSRLLLGRDHRSFGLVWVVVLGLSLILPGTIRAQGAGSLEVQLVNGTPGGAELGAGIPVVLHIYQGGTEIGTQETVTEADGSFRFDGLDTGTDLEYWPEVLYQGAFHTSAESYRFDGEQTALSTTLTVYETTDDDSAIRVDSVHVIAESFGEALRLSEIHLFGNEGDRAYIGGGDSEQGMTVFIPLPENAVGLSFGEGVDEDLYVQVEGGLMGTEPVPPGTETALAFFSYHLMVTGESVPLERNFAYPVTNLNMLVAQPGLTLSSEQLQSRGIELFQGRQYELYSTQDLSPDVPLAMELVPVADVSGGTGTAEEMPASSGERMTGATPRGNQPLILWLGVGLAALAVIAVVVYSMTARQPAAATSGGVDLASNPKAQGQLVELADLEEAFEVGEVDEAAYEHRRTEIYEELRSL